MKRILLILVIVPLLIYIGLFLGVYLIGIRPMPENPSDATTKCSYQSCRDRCESNNSYVNKEIPCPVISIGGGGGNRDAFYCISRGNSCERKLKPFCIALLNKWFYCSNFKSYSI